MAAKIQKDIAEMLEAEMVRFTATLLHLLHHRHLTLSSCACVCRVARAVCACVRVRVSLQDFENAMTAYQLAADYYEGENAKR